MAASVMDDIAVSGLKVQMPSMPSYPRFKASAWAPAPTPIRAQFQPPVSASHSTQWPHTNLTDDQSFIILITCSIVTSLALSAVVLRLASGAVKRRFNATDGATVVALILALGLWAESFLAVKFGAGKHIVVLPASSIFDLAKLVFSWRITHHLAKLATQLAILLMLKDAFTLKNRYFKWAWIIIAVLTDLTCVATVGFDILSCSPIQAAWDFTIRGRCLDQGIITIVCNAAIGATSVMTLALPILPIFFAKVSWRRKACMGALWFFAFFITWCIGAYITLMLEIVASSDFSFRLVDPLIVSVIEVGAGIIVACVPAIEKLFKKDQDSALATEEEGEDLIKPPHV